MINYKLSISIVLLLTLLACTPQNFPLSDEKYIEIASKTAEARMFLEKYPAADVVVDRSGMLAIDYRIDKNINNQGIPESYLRLRIFVDPIINSISDLFIDCYDGNNKMNSKIINDDIVGYIQNSELGKC